MDAGASAFWTGSRVLSGTLSPAFRTESWVLGSVEEGGATTGVWASSALKADPGVSAPIRTMEGRCSAVQRVSFLGPGSLIIRSEN